MHSVWAITTYFNPSGYAKRRENYKLFREHLRLPLLTVELSFGGDFELAEGDADILLQLRSGDVMFQKERLINVGVSKIPRACRKIAWLDCDVVFLDQDWTERASRALDTSPLIQPFSRSRDLLPSEAPEDISTADIDEWTPSFARYLATGGPIDRVLRRTPNGWQRIYNAGFAWAAQRELLETHGLYDACIAGGGAKALLCAATGEFASAVQSMHMTQSAAKYYEAWARPFHFAIKGQVGYVEGGLVHIWHGRLQDRQYRKRHEILAGFEFDPQADLEVRSSGCWHWNSHKPEMHAYLRDFFAKRREDFEPDPTEVV